MVTDPSRDDLAAYDPEDFRHPVHVEALLDDADTKRDDR